MNQQPSKYSLARDCVGDLASAAAKGGLGEEDCIEALLVVTIDELTKRLGRKRAAEIVRYELSNIGGDIDTVFLRSR